MGRIDVLKDEMLMAIRRDADDPVRNNAGHPEAPVRIECEAVRKSAFPELRERFFFAEIAICVQRKPRQLSCEGFIDIQIGAVRRENALVGISEIVGDNPSLSRLDEYNEAICDIAAI